METNQDYTSGTAPNLSVVHHASPVTEQGHGSTFNAHFETNPSAFSNTPVSPSSLASPRSPNPFLFPSDDTFTTDNGGMMMGDDQTHHHSSSNAEVFGTFDPFADESSSQGNPFQWPNNGDPFGAAAFESNVEPHDGFPVMNQGHHHSMGSGTDCEAPFSLTSESVSHEATFKAQSYAYHETVPTNVVESHHNAFPTIEQGTHHQGMASSTNLEIPFPTTFEPSSQSHSQDPPQVLVNASSEDQAVQPSSQSHSQDPPQVLVNASSEDQAVPLTKVGDQSIASTNLEEAPFFSVASEENSHQEDSLKVGETSVCVPSSSMPNQGQNSAAAPGFEGIIETQNPPVQVMKRSEDPADNSQYVFPSHVFDRNSPNAQAEWSAASNESLFSIYMGNMSFSGDLACFTKSNDLDKNTDISMLEPPTKASTSQEPPAQVSKFNNISQRTAEELHEESRIMTEAKAAETMREVIMETSQTTKSDDNKEGNSNSNSNSNSNANAKSNSNSDRQSDGSAKSYAFQLSSGRDKKTSSRGDEEKQTQQQQQQPEKQQEKANDATNPASKENTNAAPNKRYSCFPCCSFC